jgi:hypothetical protein
MVGHVLLLSMFLGCVQHQTLTLTYNETIHLHVYNQCEKTNVLLVYCLLRCRQQNP